MVEFTNREIQKKQDKERKLKQLSDQADGLAELNENSDMVMISTKEKNIPDSDDLTSTTDKILNIDLEKKVDETKPVSVSSSSDKNDTEAVNKLNQLNTEVCEYLGDYQETDKDLKKACDKPSSKSLV